MTPSIAKVREALESQATALHRSRAKADHKHGDALFALSASLEGYALVPVEPTEAMCVIGVAAYTNADEELAHEGSLFAAYRAMVRAAGEGQ